jgi:hypothetical protein
MARSNKTSNVLKMLNLNETPAVKQKQPVKDMPLTEAEPSAVRRPRKNITKNLKLSDSGTSNPALRAIEPEEAKPVKAYIRASDEKQIVSVPLLLINEQLGAAVERFNVCACDECLRGITIAASDLMPPMYVRVTNAADEDEVNRLIAERRAEAIRALARACITALSKPYHEN